MRGIAALVLVALAAPSAHADAPAASTTATAPAPTPPPTPAPAPEPAKPAPTVTKKVDRSMVVLDFVAQAPDEAHRAEVTTTLVSAHLQNVRGAKLITTSDVRNMLGVEKQKKLLGCNEDSSCIAEIGGALGARYIVSGSVGKVGSQILLSAAVTDSWTARSVQRLAQTIPDEDALPAAAAVLADGIGDAVGLAKTEEPAAPVSTERGFNLDVKLGNALPVLTGQQHESLQTFNLRLDLELGYFVTAQLSPFLGASAALAKNSNGESLQFIPVLLGAKYYFRPGTPWQPYAGGGIGLGFLAGKLTGDASTNTSFTVTGVGGVAYLPWRHVGFNVEASANLSGLNISGSGLLIAFNIDAGVLFVF